MSLMLRSTGRLLRSARKSTVCVSPVMEPEAMETASQSGMREMLQSRVPPPVFRMEKESFVPVTPKLTEFTDMAGIGCGVGVGVGVGVGGGVGVGVGGGGRIKVTDIKVSPPSEVTEIMPL